MYEVFINDKPVKFITGSEPVGNNSYSMVVEGGSGKSLKENFHRFVKSEVFDSLIIYDRLNIEKQFKNFISLFWYLEASGGVVRNLKNERLFIFRFGKWDLPKGKLEKSESYAEAALREVSEETGLVEPEILAELPSTYHIYEYKGKKVLKRTYWYAMRYIGSGQPVPQIEEHITETRWFKPEEYSAVLNNTYASLLGLIESDLHYDEQYI